MLTSSNKGIDQKHYLENCSKIMKFLAVVLVGLTLPLLLIIFFKFVILPFNFIGEIIEEISKAIVIFFIIYQFSDRRCQIKGALLFAFLFSLAENIFYLNQIFQVGNFNILGQRFLWTTPMHIITTLIILISGWKKKYFLIFGLILSVILHFLFNNFFIY